MAGSRQCLQRPRALASSSLSLNLVRCRSFLASGVSGVRFGLGSFGCCFLVLVALEADFCFLFFLSGFEVSPGGTREVVLRVGRSPVGFPVERFLLAVLLFALDAALYLLPTRAGSRNAYWRIILLEYCAGGREWPQAGHECCEDDQGGQNRRLTHAGLSRSFHELRLRRNLRVLLFAHIPSPSPSFMYW